MTRRSLGDGVVLLAVLKQQALAEQLSEATGELRAIALEVIRA